MLLTLVQVIAVLSNSLLIESIKLAFMLQTQELRVIQEKEPCIRVNTRELNRKLCTGLSILYTKLPWSMLLLL